MHFQFQLTRYGNLNAHRGYRTHLIAQSDTPRLLGLAAGEFGEWHFGQLSLDLQAIVGKFRHHFDGEHVPPIEGNK